jgi:hypothetical protein
MCKSGPQQGIKLYISPAFAKPVDKGIKLALQSMPRWRFEVYGLFADRPGDHLHGLLTP